RLNKACSPLSISQIDGKRVFSAAPLTLPAAPIALPLVARRLTPRVNKRKRLDRYRFVGGVFRRVLAQNLRRFLGSPMFGFGQKPGATTMLTDDAPVIRGVLHALHGEVGVRAHDRSPSLSATSRASVQRRSYERSRTLSTRHNACRCALSLLLDLPSKRRTKILRGSRGVVMRPPPLRLCVDATPPVR